MCYRVCDMMQLKERIVAAAGFLIGRLLYVRCQITIKEGRKEMFHLTTHSTDFIYSYMASDIW